MLRPCVDRSIRLVESADGMLVLGTGWPQLLRGAAAGGLVKEVLATANGTRTVSELEAALPHSAGRIQSVVDVLIGAGSCVTCRTHPRSPTSVPGCDATRRPLALAQTGRASSETGELSLVAPMGSSRRWSVTARRPRHIGEPG